MAPKSKALLMRESRQRKRDEKEREEFHCFLQHTEFSLHATDEEKFVAFQRMKSSKKPPPKSAAERKRESRKRKPDKTPANNAEKCKRYRASRANNDDLKIAERERKRQYRLREKLEMEARKRPAKEEEEFWIKLIPEVKVEVEEK
uniref:Uncharacterized protein n=1 Tax=Lygus hesperus TaxID=30085 RepID=A0A0A9X618_LYGHE